MRCAIFDLDGTLAGIEHRLHFVVHGARDWDGFFAGIPDDRIVEPIRDLLVAIRERGDAIVLCSGRPEKCRDTTVKWLADNSVPFEHLYMRPDNDTRPDHIVKMQILDGIRSDGYDPFVVIDDRQSVVDAWRDAGLTCLQCAPSEVHVPSSARLTLMVGPSCSGKTTWLASAAAKAMGIEPPHIVSSDALRVELCGDVQDQTKNERVFAAVHALARTRLKHGLPVVIDATNIRRRDRMACAALGGPNCDVRYVVINRPMAEKYRDAGWRAEVGVDFIAKHEQTFNSQLKDVLAGDGLPNVTVVDVRETKRAAA